MRIVLKTRTHDQDTYDAIHNHPAATGAAEDETDPDQEMEDLFYWTH